MEDKTTVSAKSNSDAAKLGIVKSLLDSGKFEAVITRCNSILETNKTCALAYWYLFLAENECKTAAEFEKSTNKIKNFDSLKLAIENADKKLKAECYNMLFNRAMADKRLYIYEEYISLPDSSTDNIKKLTDVMYAVLLNDNSGADHSGVFEAMLKIVDDKDKRVEMNLSFADKMFSINKDYALKCYKAVIEVMPRNEHALWQLFRINHQLDTTADVVVYLMFKGNHNIIESELFSNGFNAYAVEQMFAACLENIMIVPQYNVARLDYIFSLIPQDEYALRDMYLNEVTNSLLVAYQFTAAGRYNDIIIAEDKYNHMAYFKRLYIKRKTLCPFEFAEDGDSLLSDPDFSAAIDAYAERPTGEQNIYIQLVNCFDMLEKSGFDSYDLLYDYALTKKGLSHPISETVNVLIPLIMVFPPKSESSISSTLDTTHFFVNTDESESDVVYKILKSYVTDEQIADAPRYYDETYGKDSFKNISESMKNLDNNSFFDDKWFDNYANSQCTTLRNIVNCVQSGEALGKDQYVNVAHILIAINTKSRKLLSRLAKIIKENFGKEIGSNVVIECDDLTDADITDCIDQTIEEQAFYQCGALTRIEIPDTVTEIDYEAFCGCKNLAEVKIGSGIKKIGERAFADCKELTKIETPESDIEIGKCVFIGCDKLAEIKGKSIQEALKKRKQEIAEQKRIAEEKAAAERRKAEQEAAEKNRIAKQQAAAEKRKTLAKRIGVAIVPGALGIGLIVLGIILGFKPFADGSIDLPDLFMQEIPILLSAIICVYVCFSTLRGTRLPKAIAYAATFAGIVFVVLFLAFIIFIWIKPELFEFLQKGGMWERDKIVAMPPTWATVLAFISGIILLIQAVIGFIAEHRDGYYTLEWLLDYNWVIWVDIILTALVTVFFFIISFEFEILDNSYELGFRIFSIATFSLGLISFGLLAGDNDRMHDSYFVIHALFNCVKMGLFVLCALCVINGGVIVL